MGELPYTSRASIESGWTSGYLCMFLKSGSMPHLTYNSGRQLGFAITGGLVVIMMQGMGETTTACKSKGNGPHSEISNCES